MAVAGSGACLSLQSDPVLVPLTFGIGLACAIVAPAITSQRMAMGFAAGVAGAALMGWAMAERQAFNITVGSGGTSVRVGPSKLEAPLRAALIERVEIQLSPADDSPYGFRWLLPVGRSLRWVEQMLSRSIRGGVDRLCFVQGSEGDQEATCARTGLVLQPTAFGDSLDRSTELGSWSITTRTDGLEVLSHPAVAPPGTTSGVRLSGELARPGGTVLVRFIAGRSDESFQITISPDQRTLSAQTSLRQGDESRTYGGLFTYARDAPGWTAALVRELSRVVSLAALIWGLASLLGVVVAGRVPPDLPRPAAPLAAGVLAGVALALGVAMASGVLERIPHVQDDVTYLFQAEIFAAGRMAAPAPASPQFFEQEFILARGGEWFGKYSPGQPLLLALGVLAGAPWLVSPVLAAGAAYLLMLTSLRMYGPLTMLVTGLILVAAPFFIVMSGTMMSHPASLFWLALLLYVVTRARQGSAAGWWLIAGAAAGMALITRGLTGVAVSAPLLLALVWANRRSARRGLKGWLAACVGAAPPIAFMLYFNWRLTGSALTSPFELWWTFDRIGFAPTFGMHGGHDLANGLSNTWANLALLAQHLYGLPPLFSLVPLVIVPLSGRARPHDYVLLAVVVCLIVAYIFYWADGIMYGPRYYFEAIGALAILTARGVLLVCGLDEQPDDQRTARQVPRVRAAAFAAVAAGLWLGALGGYTVPMIPAYHGFNEISRVRLNLIENSVERPALVFVTQSWPEWQPYGSVFTANGPWLDRPIIYARDRGAENHVLGEQYPNRHRYVLRGTTPGDLTRD
ncbi:MAG: glycosyltransferase family 39 protein [Chloroflexota bacterium]